MLSLKIPLLATLAVSGTGLLGLGAWSYGHGGFRGHRDHAMMHKFIDFAVNEKLSELGATEVQKQKVREIKDRLVKDGHPLRDGHREMKAKLVALLEQDDLDPAQVKALVREQTEALTRFADEAADALVELHGLFTPEQRKQLMADLRAHAERHHR
jgi:Spy/CpxP family protein refolding chaperone